MALINCDFKSGVLKLRTSIKVILPEEEEDSEYERESKYPTLYLLHGLSDDYTAWQRFTSIERYAQDHDLAVVMPEVHRSFYTDMENGYPYWTFVTEEVPKLARSYFPLSEKREENFVAGLSMGGYGAFKMALRHPERYAAGASLSGALNIESVLKAPEGDLDNDMKLVFGDVDTLRGTDRDIYHLAEKVSKSDGPKPKLYHCCGTNDMLYQDNLDFHDFGKDLDLDITFEEGPGDHEWKYWDRKIPDVLDWLPINSKED